MVEANRSLSRQLLAAADAWLFVTSAARYADAVPSELLQAAADRGTSLSLVLDRVAPESAAEVAAHLARWPGSGAWATRSCSSCPSRRSRKGGSRRRRWRRPAWLDELAADAEGRAGLVRRTLTGALDSLPQRVGAVEQAVAEQAGVADALREAVDRAYADALEEIDEAVHSGALLRGEVLARWHEVVGTGI